ncbi:uncharacterized protein K02A2.6-like [Ornithodoros turicata]|uniref:uncharacterized protein K02A2.6-like n=1 Tax=Ornithodoros turicata TaxID=34597 RepID=UPI0031390586
MTPPAAGTAAVAAPVPNLPPPSCMNVNAADLYTEYKLWMEGYENYEIASGLINADDKVRRATLLHCIGPEVRRILSNIPGERTKYKETKKALDEYYTPKKNIVLERHKFRNREQRPDEPVSAFVNALRELAKSCNFGSLEDEMIRDQLVEKCSSKALQDRLLTAEDLTLKSALEIAQRHETAVVDSKTLTQETPVQHVKTHKKRYGNGHKKKKEQSHNQCYRCGGVNHTDDECGAKSLKCHKCNDIGHLARMCELVTKKKLQKKGNNPPAAPKSRKVHQVEAQLSEDDDDEDSSYTYFVGGSCHETVMVDSKPVKVVIDTGTKHNLMPEKLFRRLYKNHKELFDTKMKFYAYGQEKPLQCTGYFMSRITWNDKTEVHKIYVIKECGEFLFGSKSSFELGILLKPSTVQAVKAHTVPTSESTRVQPIQKLVQDNENLFQGLGTIKNYHHVVTVDKTVAPVAQRLRRIPYALKEAVSQEIENMLELGIIEESKEGSPWVSNILVVPKENTEEIRLCVDLREVNKCVIRQRHPVPTIDGLLGEMNGAKVFAKLDLKRGFWQVEIAPESRYLTTFITHHGCYQFRKVPFGLSSAPEAFQQAMDMILRGLDGVVWYLDDIIVHGTNDDELTQRLKNVFARFQEYGVKLNKRKCLFGVPSVNILGHVVSKDGIKPDPQKIQAIVDAPQPKNVDELKSFLGTCNFVRKFVPGYAMLAEPLHNLTKKSVPWEWTETVDQAFEHLKLKLAEQPCLAFYDLEAETEVITDASPVGIGGILMQRQKDGSMKPIAYASRSLTDTERRYSQIEREALGCVWAIEHFHIYLWGRSFILTTDHKPLIYMLNSEKAVNLPPRVRRLSWRLLPYSYKIQFIKGQENIADMLSRLPLPGMQGSTYAEEYVSRICSTQSEELKAVTLQELQKASCDDKEIKIIQRVVITGKWPVQSSSEILHFKKLADELSVFENLLLRGERVVVPRKLRKRVLQVAHEVHQGIVRTKQILRQRFYWTNMDSDVQELLRSCTACTLNQPLKADYPFQTVELPPEPWTKLGMDLVGPIGSDFILTVIDYYSSFPEAFVMRDTSSSSIKVRLRTLFSRMGYPSEIVTDNGRQFISHEMEEFFSCCGIKHIRCSPYYPQSNGKIERFHRYLKKQLSCATAENKDWKTAL